MVRDKADVGSHGIVGDSARLSNSGVCTCSRVVGRNANIAATCIEGHGT